MTCLGNLFCRLKTVVLVFKDPVAHQVIYVRNHFTIGKAHLVPIEGLTEDYRGQFGNCLWSDLTTFGDLSAAIPMMLLQLLDSSTHPVNGEWCPGRTNKSSSRVFFKDSSERR